MLSRQRGVLRKALAKGAGGRLAVDLHYFYAASMFDLKRSGMELHRWEEKSLRKPCSIEGEFFDKVYALTYQKEEGGELFSLSRIFFKDKELFRAWGKTEEEHCSFHSVFDGESMSDPLEGCPVVSVSKEEGVITLEALGEIYHYKVA